MDSIVFIESNTTGTGERFLLAAHKLGLRVIFLTAHPEKYLFLKSLLIHPVVIDTNDVEVIYNYLKYISNVVGITSTSEKFIYNAAVIAKKFALPHPNPSAIASCRDKYKFSELIKDAGLPTIATTNNPLSLFNLPVVVKPNPGTGSIGVKLCNTSQEVDKHIKDLQGSDILIQEYIVGEEYSAEIVVLKNHYHVLGITKKYLGSEPYFVEYGHDFPANISATDEVYNNITNTLFKALEKVHFNFGPVHVEFRIADEKVYIIEINPRLAGGMIPILIEHSTGIPLIENIIKMCIGKEVDFQPNLNFSTKIAFIIPEKEGIIKQISNIEQLSKQANIVEVSLYKNVGDIVTLKGDFSDRIGFVIAKAKTVEECADAIRKNLTHISITIDSNSHTHGRSRLSEPLDSRIKKILENNIFDNLDDLTLLSKINIAHVRMLKDCEIISHVQATALLTTIQKLESENFASVRLLNDCSIGLYFAYEQRLIEMLGIETAGIIHTGRSRNDINATIQRLKSKEVLNKLYKTLWSLRSNILQVAQKSTHVAMPIYSQYQAAMPGTYAYYLIAVENSLAYMQAKLKHMIDDVNTATLGAASGGGTTYPINPNITGDLLGLSVGMPNALTVVASRDLELMLLSAGSILGVTISRMAQDFHMWLTKEFSLFELPDSLCGVSSAMPQKKNPYLLEKIKGKAIGISGKLAAAMATMHKVPFANSVEIGTESLIGYVENFAELIKAIELLSLIVLGANPIKKNMDRSNKEGLTVATVVAESIAKQNKISCREAHGIVAQTINKALQENLDPLEMTLSLAQKISPNPDIWHEDFEYGNGSGVKSTIKMLENSINNLNNDGEFFNAKFNILHILDPKISI